MEENKMKIFLVKLEDGTYGVSYEEIKKLLIDNLIKVFETEEKAKEEFEKKRKKLEESETGKRLNLDFVQESATKNLLLVDLKEKDLLYFINNNTAIPGEFGYELEGNLELVMINKIEMEEIKALYFIIDDKVLKLSEIKNSLFSNNEDVFVIRKKLLTRSEYRNLKK